MEWVASASIRALRTCGWVATIPSFDGLQNGKSRRKSNGRVIRYVPYPPWGDKPSTWPLLVPPYVLLSALRRLALSHTNFQTAACGTIRLKLLKIAAKVTVSVRRITVSMATAFPWTHELRLAIARLLATRPAPA